jgi:hypothetical protein
MPYKLQAQHHASVLQLSLEYRAAWSSFGIMPAQRLDTLRGTSMDTIQK